MFLFFFVDIHCPSSAHVLKPSHIQRPLRLYSVSFKSGASNLHFILTLAVPLRPPARPPASLSIAKPTPKKPRCLCLAVVTKLNLFISHLSSATSSQCRLTPSRFICSPALLRRREMKKKEDNLNAKEV